MNLSNFLFRLLEMRMPRSSSFSVRDILDLPQMKNNSSNSVGTPTSDSTSPTHTTDITNHGLRTHGKLFFQHIPNVWDDWPNKLCSIWGIFSRPWFYINQPLIFSTTKTKLFRHFQGISIWLWGVDLGRKNFEIRTSCVRCLCYKPSISW